MSRDPRQAAVTRIERLCRLAKAVREMIDAEQALIAHAIPYPGNDHCRTNAALHRAAYAVFEADDLHSMAIELDPDFIVSDRGNVLVLDERSGTSYRECVG